MNRLLVALAMLIPHVALCQDQVQDVTNNSYFGVPSSPAFELLPDKPSEVTHILTPKDITTFVPLTLDGNSVKTNVGVDVRPFSFIFMNSSLKDYQEKGCKRVLWRTVLSGGTSSVKDSKDSYLAFGLRFPIIDKGDPRANVKYNEDLISKMHDLPPPETLAGANIDSLASRLKQSLDPIRKKFIETNWNARRLDLGIGNMWLLSSSSIKRDSIDQNRFGVWAAYSDKLGKRTQFILSVKNAWIVTNSDESENSRSSVGGRLRFFSKYAAFSVEYAKIFSGYKEESLNENWDHFAALVEIPVPKLKGVIGLAYGGDSSRREDSDAKFEFKYSIYADQILKK